MTINATFAGLPIVGEGGANITLQPGTAPSTGSATLDADEAIIKALVVGDLVFSDPDSPDPMVTLKDMEVRSYRTYETERGTYHTVELADSRWRWRNLPLVYVVFNIDSKSPEKRKATPPEDQWPPKPDYFGGTNVPSNLTTLDAFVGNVEGILGDAYPPECIYFNASVKEILEWLCGQLKNVKGFVVDTTVPDDVFPYLKYEGVAITEIFDEILDAYELNLYWTPEQKILITKRYSADPPTEGQYIYARTEGVEFERLPKYICIHGAASLYQLNVPLIPAGDSLEAVDTNEGDMFNPEEFLVEKVVVRPLWQIRYAPDNTDFYGGFRPNEVFTGGEFVNLEHPDYPGFNDSGYDASVHAQEHEKVRRHAADSIFRTYVVPYFIPIAEEINEVHAVKDDSGVIVHAERARPYITATVEDWSPVKKSVTIENKKITEGITIDHEKGIVYLNERILAPHSLDDADVVTPAEAVLTMAIDARCPFVATRPDNYLSYYYDTSTQVGSFTRPEDIDRRNCLSITEPRLKRRFFYDGTTNTIIESPEDKAFLEDYLLKLAKYTQRLFSEDKEYWNREYVGLPEVKFNGSVSSITWTATQNGLTTAISYNTDEPPIDLPTIKEINLYRRVKALESKSKKAPTTGQNQRENTRPSPTTKRDDGPAQQGTIATISVESDDIPVGSIVALGVLDSESRRTEISKPTGSSGVFGITSTKHTSAKKRGFVATKGIWPVVVSDASGFTVGNYANPKASSYEPEEVESNGLFRIVDRDTDSDTLWLEFQTAAGGSPSGGVLVKITARTAASTYTVKLSEWDGTTSGGDITGMQCYPPTDYLAVGHLAFIVTDSTGAGRLIPVVQAVWGEG